MAFTDTQTRALKAKLSAKYVKTRQGGGLTLHYIEGWHAIAEANRVFGFDAWDRQTVATRCVWEGTLRNLRACSYTATVRIQVRAGGMTIVREGSGSPGSIYPYPVSGRLGGTEIVNRWSVSCAKLAVSRKRSRNAVLGLMM